MTKLLRGIAGTPLKVTVRRPYVTDSILTFDMVRGKLGEPSVPYWDVINGNTGYIRLTSFISQSGKDVREALEAFKRIRRSTRLCSTCAETAAAFWNRPSTS